MGQYHFFRELHKFATKNAKFKQNVLIEALHEKGEITQEQQFVRTHGACAALCCMWFRTKLMKYKAFNRSKGVRVDEEIALPYAKIAVGVQTLLHKGFKPEEWSQRNTDMYKAFGLSFEIDGDRHNGAGNLAGKTASLLKYRPGVLMSADLKNGKSHAIGMAKVDGVTLFFDPNAGEYTVQDVIGFL